MPHQQVIRIRSEAPPKPDWGMACNGCGVCCLAEPCPLGVLLSRSRKGPCKALRWSTELSQYRCGALQDPLQAIGHTAQRRLGSIGLTVVEWRNRLVARWIAAGSGCDCALEPLASATMLECNEQDPDARHD